MSAVRVLTDGYCDAKVLLKAIGRTERLKLPCPRLQLTWATTDGEWRYRVCIYTMVIPLQKYDIRSEGKDGKCGVHKECHAILGLTRSDCGEPVNPAREGIVDTPYRDGAHARFDSQAFGGLPIYAVCEKTVTKIEPPNDEQKGAQ